MVTYHWHWGVERWRQMPTDIHCRPSTYSIHHHGLKYLPFWNSLIMYKERICGLDKSILNGAEKFSSLEILHIFVRVLIYLCVQNWITDCSSLCIDLWTVNDQSKSKYTKTLNPKPELCADHKPTYWKYWLCFMIHMFLEKKKLHKPDAYYYFEVIFHGSPNVTMKIVRHA